MTFRNEVMDFVATYRAMNPAKSGQDRYYDRLREDQLRQDKIARDAVTAANKARQRGTQPAAGASANIVPQVASTATPGLSTAPAQQVAMSTNWPEMAPIYRRGGPVKRMNQGGPVKRYDIGGNVTAEDEQNEADLIVRSLLARDGSLGGADTDDAYLSTGNARMPPTPDTADDTGLHGRLPPGKATARANQRIMELNIPQPEDQPLGARDVAAIKTTTPPPRPTSRYEEWATTGIDEDAANAREKVGEWNQRMQERKAARRQAGRVVLEERKDPFTPKTAEEHRESLERQRAAEATRSETAPPDRVYADDNEKLVALETGAAPPREPMPASSAALPVLRNNKGQAIDDEGNVIPEPAAPPPRDTMPELAPGAPAVVTAAPSVAGPVRPAVTDPNMAWRQGVATGDVDPDAVGPPSAYPTKVPPATPPKASNGALGGGAGTNSPSGGNSGPGSGAGQVNAPPAVRTEDPRTRTAAFDPNRERINPDRTTAPRQIDAQGQVIYPTQQEMAQMISTAAQPHMGNGQAPHLGQGAVNRSTVQALVADTRAQHGSQLTDGEALMVGMHAKFKYLVSQGRMKDAAQMAWGLIQAANMEAAAYGMQARDQAMSGNMPAAIQSVANGANWAMDGVRHEATPSGIKSTDASGRVTVTPVDGKTVLQMALQLSDGSAMWNMLQQAASMVMPQPDKGAEGRELDNVYKRLKIEAAKRKLAGGGGKASAAPSGNLTALRHYLAGTTPPAPTNSGGGERDDTFNDNDWPKGDA